MSTWKISGQYMETCNCLYLCPCISANLAARPTEGSCKAAIAMRIDEGMKDDVSLSGISFVLMLDSPGVMADGNITVGLIVDEAASAEQLEAISVIATGSAGGPMAALAPLVGKIAGVERSSIQFEVDGLQRRVKAGKFLEQSCEGVPSAVSPGMAICLENTVHPANSRLSLAKAIQSRFNVFGMDWQDASGSRNGHFAPFSWAN